MSDRYRDEEWEVASVDNRSRLYRKSPCSECPWRKDVETHRFPPHVFRDSASVGRQPSSEQLQAWCDSTDDDGEVNEPIQRMFACHMSGNGERVSTCAGFLASDSSRENLAVRIAVTFGSIPVDALEPKPWWPELYMTHEEMARANGAYPEEEERPSECDD